MSYIIISNYYPPEMGAASNRIKMMAGGLKDQSNSVHVICPMPNYPTGKVFEGYKGKILKNEKDEDIDVYRYWIYPSNSKNPLLRLLSMLSFSVSLWLSIFKKKKFRKVNWVIIQNSPLLVSFSSIILFRWILRKKIALNVSDLWPLSALELGVIQKGKLYSFLEQLERFNYKYSDLIIGQSNEILTHVHSIVNRPTFLYRNIQDLKEVTAYDGRSMAKVKLIYAGLLGVAQGVFDIIKNVDFTSLGVEFHVYGDGNERQQIEAYLSSNKDSGVFYHGSVSKADLYSILPKFHMSIVPLVTRIKGAVPSKIFELCQMGIPVLFCGGGEGADIINRFEIGLTSAPGDYRQIEKNILELKSYNQEEYDQLVNQCLKVAEVEFNFETQIEKLKLELI